TNPSITTILGIETSCDDTSVAVVDSNRNIRSEYRKAQWDIHKKFNGVVPKLASDAHKAVIDEAVEQALAMANTDINAIDAIAVTTGPGIALSLEVGLEKGRQLAKQYNKPFISVNHLEGHCLACRLSCPDIQFPFMTLLVSGGHSQLLVCHGVSSYTLLGNTLDDSVGEALDKTARMLGCGFGEVDDGDKKYTNIHGGEAIEILSRKGDPKRFPFTIPLIGSKNCDFSFSGLKSSVKRLIGELTADKPNGELSNRDRFDLAASFQYCAFKHLEKKTLKAITWYNSKLNTTVNGKLFEPLRGLVVTGGVSKNKKLRQQFEELGTQVGVQSYFPEPALCTDNGTMIAWAGIEMYKHKMFTAPEDAYYLPVWPLDPSPISLFESNLKPKDIKIREGWYKDVVEKYGPTTNNSSSSS
ncbi:hypothetical protein SAMD00019534_048690, partial [Acytostelium subglobosum LB1]|uniref:hypothetical protein n=1 Tax=Acytostelium subglobosum LB1 TaxID=1410327 RepID=UPI000644FCC2